MRELDPAAQAAERAGGGLDAVGLAVPLRHLVGERARGADRHAGAAELAAGRHVRGAEGRPDQRPRPAVLEREHARRHAPRGTCARSARRGCRGCSRDRRRGRRARRRARDRRSDSRCRSMPTRSTSCCSSQSPSFGQLRQPVETPALRMVVRLRRQSSLLVAEQAARRVLGKDQPQDLARASRAGRPCRSSPAMPSEASVLQASG